MIREAAERYNIDLAGSWMIGDTTMDIQTGINAGMRTALVLTGEAGNDKKYDVKPDLVCKDLLDAVEKIFTGRLTMQYLEKQQLDCRNAFRTES